MRFHEDRASELRGIETAENTSLSEARITRSAGIIPELRGDEIAISLNGLKPHFIGDPQALSKKLKDLIKADPSRTSSDQTSLIVAGENILLFKRQNGSQAVWALPLFEKPRLAKAIGWSVKTNLEQIREDEIALSNDGISSHFICTPTQAKRQLKAFPKENPKRTNFEEVSFSIAGENFLLYRRQRGSSIVWVLPLTEKSRFAKAMGWSIKTDLKHASDDEFVVSGPGIHPHFIGSSHYQSKQLKDLIKEDPSRTKLVQTSVFVAGEHFSFLKRQQGSHIVWALPLAEKYRFAKAIGWLIKTDLEHIKEDEIALSPLGLSPHYIGPKNELSKQLKDLINENPRQTNLNQTSLVLAGEHFLFFRRQRGSQFVWALPLADKPRLAKAMGWSIKTGVEHIRDDEIAVSGPGISSHFIGHPKKLKKQLQAIVKVDPRQTNLNETSLILAGERLSFFRRQHGVHIVWALPLAEKPRFAKAMGWLIKTDIEQIREDEVAISVSGLYPHFIGNSNDQCKQLNVLIKEDPTRTKSDHTSLFVEGEHFTFLRRQNGTHIIWALPHADKLRLANAMGWSIKHDLEQMRRDEFTLSAVALKPHFVGDSRELRNQLNLLIKADPRQTDLNEISIILAGEHFLFLRRQHKSQIVWALPLSDKPRLAKAMNWALKEDNKPSTGIADLATFLSVTAKRDADASNRPGSVTQR